MVTVGTNSSMHLLMKPVTDVVNSSMLSDESRNCHGWVKDWTKVQHGKRIFFLYSKNDAEKTKNKNQTVKLWAMCPEQRQS